jgi:hypothetical protein
MYGGRRIGMTSFSEPKLPSKLLPFERSAGDALRIYLERLAVFVGVVVISGAICGGILYGKVGSHVPSAVILVVLLIQDFLFMYVLRAEKKDRRRIVERYEELMGRLEIRADAAVPTPRDAK